MLVQVNGGVLTGFFQQAQLSITQPVLLPGTIEDLNSFLASMMFTLTDPVMGNVSFAITTSNSVIQELIQFLATPPPSESPSLSSFPSTSTTPASTVVISPPMSSSSSPPKATSSPTNQDVVECTSAEGCTLDVVKYLKDKGIAPCVDISKSCGNDVDCFSLSDSGATSKCKPAADYKVAITKETAKKEQKLTIFSQTVLHIRNSI